MTPLESWATVGGFVFGGAYAITGLFVVSGRILHYVNSVGYRGMAEALIGGAYIATAAGLTAVLAPIAAVFSDKQAEAEDKLAEAVTKKPYAEQKGYGHVPGKPVVEIEPGVTTDEEFKRILDEIEAA